MEVAHGGEPSDVVDFEQQQIGDHRSDPRDPQEPLRIGGWEHAIAQLVFEAANPGLQQRVLLGVQRRLEARQCGQLRRRLDVVLLEERADGSRR